MRGREWYLSSNKWITYICDGLICLHKYPTYAAQEVDIKGLCTLQYYQLIAIPLLAPNAIPVELINIYIHTHIERRLARQPTNQHGLSLFSVLSTKLSLTDWMDHCSYNNHRDAIELSQNRPCNCQVQPWESDVCELFSSLEIVVSQHWRDVVVLRLCCLSDC